MTASMNNQFEDMVRIRPASPNDFGGVLVLFGQLWPDKVLNKDRQGEGLQEDRTGVCIPQKRSARVLRKDGF